MLPNKAALSTRPPPEGSPAVCQAIYADRAAGTVRSPLDAAVGVLPMPGRRLDSIASGSWRESRLDRMSRDEFFAKVAPLDEERLRKALWNLYWRGTAATRERIEAELTPEVGLPRQKAAEPADPARVREEAEDFVALARAGVYIAGSRRVSPKERSRWRFTFKRLLAEARDTLRATDLDPGVAAMTHSSTWRARCATGSTSGPTTPSRRRRWWSRTKSPCCGTESKSTVASPPSPRWQHRN
jgi:hypothetical protein